jgi:hypothetical protein
MLTAARAGSSDHTKGNTMATAPATPKSNAKANKTILAPDTITTKKVSEHPCDVVSFIGYLGKSSSDTYVRLYDDLTFREWTAIPADAIKDREPVESPNGITKSLVWVDIHITVVRCQAVPVLSYGSQAGAGMQPGDEDLAYEYPRRPRPRP